MKRNILNLMALFCLTAALAQPELPAPSPKVKLSQTVGLTEVTVEYSSPAVNGRTVWGGLVPYNTIWRTGANMATKVTFSKPVTIQGKEVPAGSYALFSIPSENEWTLILNKNWNQGGTEEYKQEEDVVRVNVKAKAIAHRERFTVLVTDYTMSQGNLTIEWEKVSVSLPFSVATETQAKQNIEKALGGTWRQYASSARYLYENTNDLDLALKYIDQSIALNEGWYNCWFKALILNKKGDKKEAIKWAKKAKELGDKTPESFWYKKDVEKALAEWK